VGKKKNPCCVPPFRCSLIIPYAGTSLNPVGRNLISTVLTAGHWTACRGKQDQTNSCRLLGSVPKKSFCPLVIKIVLSSASWNIKTTSTSTGCMVFVLLATSWSHCFVFFVHLPASSCWLLFGLQDAGDGGKFLVMSVRDLEQEGLVCVGNSQALHIVMIKTLLVFKKPHVLREEVFLV